jgi:CheY-like chemotaxis protein
MADAPSSPAADLARDAERMEAVGRLAGGIAHDFSNLLTIVLGATDQLREQLPAIGPHAEQLELIHASAERAALITQRLLAFARQRVPAPALLNLNDLVLNSERYLRPLLGERIDIRMSCGRDLGSVKADRLQIEQALLTFAMSAQEAMPSGGTLTIATVNVDVPHADQAIKPGRYVLTTITDTGRQAGAKRTGIGVATTQGIVKHLGGAVCTETVPDGGTRVLIYLPRYDTADDVLVVRGTAAVAHGGSETLLLVEDEASVRELVKEMLERAGYAVLEAHDPEAAERISAEFPGTIHLLLTDMMMPETNGRELADRVLVQRPAVRVLFMSGYPEQVVASGGTLEPGTHFIAKPFDRKSLLRHVRHILDT